MPSPSCSEATATQSARRRDDVAGELGRITAPTLIAWGARDALCSRRDQEALLAAIAGSRIAVYDNAGHALHWEEPERFATRALRRGPWRGNAGLPMTRGCSGRWAGARVRDRGGGADRSRASLTAPVVGLGHLIALNVLLRDDRTRPQDRVDLAALLSRADDAALGEAHESLALVTWRGFQRGRDRSPALDAAVSEFRGWRL